MSSGASGGPTVGSKPDVRDESLNLGAAPGSQLRAPSPSDPLTAEKRAMSGYDSHGGVSSELPVAMSHHLGAQAAPDTLTSGSVGGEAWDVDALTRLSEHQLEEHIKADHEKGVIPTAGLTGADRNAAAIGDGRPGRI